MANFISSVSPEYETETFLPDHNSAQKEENKHLGNVHGAWSLYKERITIFFYSHICEIVIYASPLLLHFYLLSNMLFSFCHIWHQLNRNKIKLKARDTPGLLVVQAFLVFLCKRKIL